MVDDLPITMTFDNYMNIFTALKSFRITFIAQKHHFRLKRIWAGCFIVIKT